MAEHGKDPNTTISEDFKHSPGHSFVSGSSQSGSYLDHPYRLDRTNNLNHARAEDEPHSIHDNTIDPHRFMFHPATEPTMHISGHEYSDASFHVFGSPFGGFTYSAEGRYLPVVNQPWHRPDRTAPEATARPTYHCPVNSSLMVEGYDSSLSTTNNTDYLSPPSYLRAGRSPTYMTTPSPIDSTMNNLIDSDIASPDSIHTPLTSTIGTPMTSHSQSSPHRNETAYQRNPSSLHGLRFTIERLWLQEGRTIKQVVKILEDEHNLKTSERTLKRRLKQWGDRKRRPRN